VTSGDPLQRETTLLALETTALERIKPTELQDPVRRGIRLAFEWSHRTDMRLERRTLPKTDGEAAAIVVELLRAVGRPDPRPAWRTLGDARAWEAFVERSTPPESP